MELGDLSASFPRRSSDLDVGQGDVTIDLQRVYHLECLEPMGEVEKVLAIGKHIKELPRAKWVVGHLPLFSAPRAIHKAVANHTVTYAGV